MHANQSYLYPRFSLLTGISHRFDFNQKGRLLQPAPGLGKKYPVAC
jgi:hypothetical protein